MAAMGGPPAARLGDACVPHCSGSTMAKGSPNVLVNFIPWCTLGDQNTPHLLPVPGNDPCKIHVAAVAKGSTTVIVNGRPAARLGDKLTACTAIAMGSPTVLCGG